MLNPHILVYFGAHLTTKEAAAAALPPGVLRDEFLPHYKGPGWLSMQQWEASAITHVFLGNKDPRYVDPLPRLRLLSKSECLAEIPLDVIKDVLRNAGVELLRASDKLACVAQLQAKDLLMISPMTSCHHPPSNKICCLP